MENDDFLVATPENGIAVRRRLYKKDGNFMVAFQTVIARKPTSAHNTLHLFLSAKYLNIKFLSLSPTNTHILEPVKYVLNFVT